MSLWVFPGPEKTARDASLAGLKEREEDDEGKKSTNEMMHRLPPPPLRKHPNRPRGLRARRARPFREGEGARHAALCRHRLTCRAKEKASESCAARSKKEELRLFESSLCVCGSSGGALEKEEEEEEEGGGGPLPCFGPPQRQPSLAGLLKDRALHCRDLERTVACTRLLLRRSAKRWPLPPPPHCSSSSAGAARGKCRRRRRLRQASTVSFTTRSVLPPLSVFSQPRCIRYTHGSRPYVAEIIDWALAISQAGQEERRWKGERESERERETAERERETEREKMKGRESSADRASPALLWSSAPTARAGGHGQKRSQSLEIGVARGNQRKELWRW